jgi:UDP-N-acetyl-D-glucosamine dehydrogenase
MGIDVWEVIDAAATKPFGFMPFYPGPGLGGHCIPIDPFYLTWKAREVGYPTRFIELAGEINVFMPRYVIQNLAKALDKHRSRSLGVSSVLVIGLAYKKNVSDIRESPSLVLMQSLRDRGTQVAYYDPHVPVITPTREHGALSGLQSVELTPDTVASFDALLITTDHDDIDYDLIHTHANLIVDTRNAFERRGYRGDKIIKT